MFYNVRASYVVKTTLICLMSACVAACSPSTEGETEDWTENTTTVGELTSAYPGFKTVFDAELAAATKMWESAEKESDETKKAEAMKKTNTHIEELIDPLSEIQSKSKGIEDTITKLGNLKLIKNSSESSKRKRVMGEIGDVKVTVAMALSAAAPQDRAEALTLIEEQKDKIVDAWSKGNRTLSSLKGDKKKKDKKKSKKKDKKKSKKKDKKKSKKKDK